MSKMNLCENCCSVWNYDENKGNNTLCLDCLNQQQRAILYALHVDSDQRDWTKQKYYKDNGILKGVRGGFGSPEGLDK